MLRRPPVGSRKVGRLERAGDYAFAYHPEASPSDAVSLTMPVRLKSWQSRDLHPVFQMNLPEGALRIAVRGAIAKVDVVHLSIPPARAREIVDRVADAVEQEREEVLRYMGDHPGFAPVGEGMLAAWRAGVDALARHGGTSRRPEG